MNQQSTKFAGMFPEIAPLHKNDCGFDGEFKSMYCNGLSKHHVSGMSHMAQRKSDVCRGVFLPYHCYRRKLKFKTDSHEKPLTAIWFHMLEHHPEKFYFWQPLLLLTRAPPLSNRWRLRQRIARRNVFGIRNIGRRTHQRQ